MKTLYIPLICCSLLTRAGADVVYIDHPDFTYPMGSIPAETTFQLLDNTPLNQNQGAEFIFSFQPAQVSFQRLASQAPSADVLSSGGLASRLTPGATIGPTQSWAASGLLDTPQWDADGTIGYLGARANPATDSATYYYGWVRISFNPDRSITLYDWAYESTPNTPILAAAVPEPSACLLLSLASLAMLFLRRRMEDCPASPNVSSA